MATMNISLPATMRDWVEKQTNARQYSSNSDYVRDLIRRDKEQQEKHEALQKAITEGLQSGVSDRSVSEIIEEAKKEMKA